MLVVYIFLKYWISYRTKPVGLTLEHIWNKQEIVVADHYYNVLITVREKLMELGMEKYL